MKNAPILPILLMSTISSLLAMDSSQSVTLPPPSLKPTTYPDPFYQPSSLLNLAAQKVASLSEGKIDPKVKKFLNYFDNMEEIAPLLKLAIARTFSLQPVCKLPAPGILSPDGTKIVINTQGVDIYSAQNGEFLGSAIPYSELSKNIQVKWGAGSNYFCVNNGRNSDLYEVDVRHFVWSALRINPLSASFTANERYLLVNIANFNYSLALFTTQHHKHCDTILNQIAHAIQDPQGKLLITADADVNNNFNQVYSFSDNPFRQKPVPERQHVINGDTNFCFSQDGELICSVRKMASPDTTICMLHNRTSNKTITFPPPPWQWYKTLGLHINPQKTRFLIYNAGLQCSMVYDIASQQLIHAEFNQEKIDPSILNLHYYYNTQLRGYNVATCTTEQTLPGQVAIPLTKHFYSRDLSKIIFLRYINHEKTFVYIKDLLSGTLLHELELNAHYPRIQHAPDNTHVLLIGTYTKNNNCLVSTALINLATGQLLGQYDQQPHVYPDKAILDCSYAQSSYFSQDGKYLSYDPIRKEAQIWQLPPPLDLQNSKYLVSTMMRYRVLADRFNTSSLSLLYKFLFDEKNSPLLKLARKQQRSLSANDLTLLQ